MVLTKLEFTQAAEAIGHFRLVQVRFVLTATTAIQLPPYKGSAFRGGFGHALKHIACAMDTRVCTTCQAPDHCVYSYLFETKLRQDGAGDESIPRPFVLIPPLESYETYAPGDILTCHLVLAGDGIDYLPHFIVAMQQLGQMGVGRHRGRYTMSQVQILPPNAPAYEIYAGSADRFQDLRAATTAADLLLPYDSVSPCHLTLEFVTPTRLKHQGRLVKQAPPFHVILRRLLDRIAEFSLFFHATPLDLDLKVWKRQSEAIRAANSQVRHHDWERYSHRQGTRMKLGGVVGTAAYSGDLAPFLPLLALGEWLHVGKGATFGLGKYRIVDMG
jgi:CRISPR/Cas system endoribonuclease Cas6 (RAMP superfamily)